MATLLISSRTFQGTAEGDRPPLAVCRVGDQFHLPDGTADVVVQNGAGALTWQSLVSAPARRTRVTLGGSTPGTRTLTVSVKDADGDEVPCTVRIVAQGVATRTLSLTSSARVLDHFDNAEGANAWLQVVKGTDPLTVSASCSGPGAPSFVDVLVDGVLAASMALPFST